MLIVPKSTAKRKKVSNSQFVAIALILLFSSFSSAGGQAQSVSRSDSHERDCEVVAKVISGDINWTPQSKLCKNDKIHPVRGRKVEIFCYSHGKLLYLTDSTVSEHCLPLSQRRFENCTLKNGYTCVTPKGPGSDENIPTLITPYGVVILNTNPILSWSATPEATSYMVQIEGKGVNWSVEVKATQLPYPKDQPAMESGNVYNVNVIANRGDEPIAASASILLIVPTDKAQEIATTINRLQSLNQFQDELAIDVDSVYETENLVNESILVLKARAKAGSKNPTIYRLLGDRYLEAYLPSAAISAYATASKLARKENNADELVKAEAGAKIADQSQKRVERARGS